MRTYAGLISLLTLLSPGCAPDPNTTIFIQGHTEQGLLKISKEIAQARVGTLKAEGDYAFFTSSILASSTLTVHTSGRLTVARGGVQVSFTNRDGSTQTVRATPGNPGEWKADVRTSKPRDGRTGFLVRFEPLGGPPPQAEGVLLEVTYEAG